MDQWHHRLQPQIYRGLLGFILQSLQALVVAAGCSWAARALVTGKLETSRA